MSQKKKVPKWIFYFLSLGGEKVCEMPISFERVVGKNYSPNDYSVNEEITIVRGYSTMGLRTTTHRILKKSLRKDRDNALGLLVFVSPALPKKSGGGDGRRCSDLPQ